MPRRTSTKGVAGTEVALGVSVGAWQLEIGLGDVLSGLEELLKWSVARMKTIATKARSYIYQLSNCVVHQTLARERAMLLAPRPTLEKTEV